MENLIQLKIKYTNQNLIFLDQKYYHKRCIFIKNILSQMIAFKSKYLIVKFVEENI